jgi:hypothetical protein
MIFAPIDDDTLNLLDLIADDPRRSDEYDRFLAACQSDALTHGGLVSVNRVRRRMSNDYGLTIHPRTYSAFWSKACARGGPMVTTTEWELCTDTRGRNGGKPQRYRRWVGAA